jgi:hypothetical protein
MKGYQYRHYVRMREIEHSAYLINSVSLGGKFGDKKISAPRIDMTWGFKGYPRVLRPPATSPPTNPARAASTARRRPLAAGAAGDLLGLARPFLVAERSIPACPRSRSRDRISLLQSRSNASGIEHLRL